LNINIQKLKGSLIMKELINRVILSYKNYTGKRVAKRQKKNRYVSRMESLKVDLKRTLEAIAVRKDDANKKVLDASNNFEKAFKEYDEAYRRHVQGYITSKEFQLKKEVLVAFREALDSANDELDKLKDLEKAEVIRITGEMNNIKHKFVRGIAVSTLEKSKELQRLKKQYMQKVVVLSEEYRSVITTEALINDCLSFYEFNTSKTIVEEYGELTKDYPVTLEQLALNEERVIELLTGR
jgi:hypothetical protein